MRDSLLGGLALAALAMVLALAAPHSISAQDKKDGSTANNPAEAGEPPNPRSESRLATAVTGVAKPDTPLPAPTNSYHWTGGYVGGHAGWGRGRANTSFTPLPNAVQFIDLTPTTLRPNPSGFNGGAQAGYNWQSGRFVVGAEADVAGGKPRVVRDDQLTAVLCLEGRAAR